MCVSECLVYLPQTFTFTSTTWKSVICQRAASRSGRRSPGGHLYPIVARCYASGELEDPEQNQRHLWIGLDSLMTNLFSFLT